MGRQHVSGKISASCAVITMEPSPTHLVHLFWKCYFMLNTGIEDFTPSQLNQKTSCSLEEASTLRTQADISCERQPQLLLETSCQTDRAMET